MHSPVRPQGPELPYKSGSDSAADNFWQLGRQEHESTHAQQQLHGTMNDLGGFVTALYAAKNMRRHRLQGVNVPTVMMPSVSKVPKDEYKSRDLRNTLKRLSPESDQILHMGACNSNFHVT